MDDWDWELLNDSKNPEVETQVKVEVEEEEPQKSASSTGSLCDDCGVIHSDYFSLESQHHKFTELQQRQQLQGEADEEKQEEQDEEDEDDDEEVSSDNPSWVDPTNLSVAVRRRERISSCSNSDSSDPSDSRNLHLLIDPHSDCALDFSPNIWPHSRGIEKTPVSGEFDDAIHSLNNGHNFEEQHEPELEVDQELYSQSNVNSVSEEEERVSESNSESNDKNKIVWWKVPLEVLKYCVLRVSPVWSLSMAAAAVMGFVILRRRYLYKMKRKTQGLQLKVTVDDKKVSQFMSRAARLNEAFSVVKRVPIIRPTLPAPGLAPWPMVSLR